MRMLRITAGLLLACLGAGAARAACSVPNVFVPNTVISSAAMNANFAAVVTCANGITSPFASAQAALASIPATAGTVLVTSATLPPATYNSQAIACLFSDGGSQIPITAPGGGCWVLAPQAVYDIRWWSLSTPNHFYADPNGNDYGGANFCVVAALPCQTLQQAYNSLKTFNMQRQDSTINLAAGTYQGIPMTADPPGGGNGASLDGTLGPRINIVGAGNTTVITNTTAPLGVMFVDGRTSVLFSNLEISTPNNQDGIFVAGLGSFVTIGTGFTCFGQVGALSCYHIEGQSRIATTPNINVTYAGSWISIWETTLGAAPQNNIGTATCAGGLTISSSWIVLDKGATAFLANTFSGCNTVSANNFIVSGNSILDDNLITWPTMLTNGILRSGGRHTLQDVPCVGGAASCNNATAPSGWPAGSTFSFADNAGLHSGQVKISANATAAVAGATIWLNFPSILEVTGSSQLGQCTAAIGKPTGGNDWPAGSDAHVIAQNAANGESIEIVAQSNGANLTNGNVYAINWQCDAD